VRWLLSEKRLATGGELLCFLTAGHHEEAVVELLCLAVARKMFSAVMLSTNPLQVSQFSAFVHQQTGYLV
jgi:hypothetical protein